MKIYKYLSFFLIPFTAAAEAVYFSLEKIILYGISLPKIVVFDWDNTLVYSWPKLLKVMNQTLCVYGKNPISMERLLEFHSIPQDQIIKILFGKERKDVLKKYWELYEKEFGNSVHLVEDTINFLQILKANNVKIAILSNQKGYFLRRHVKNAHLDPFIDIVIGEGDLENNKPHPNTITHILKEINLNIDVNRHNIWLVGDSITDMETSRNGDILGVFVSKYATQDIGLYVFENPPHLLLSVASIKELKRFYINLLRINSLKINRLPHGKAQKNIACQGV